MSFTSKEMSRGKASACSELGSRAAVGCTWLIHKIWSDEIISLNGHLEEGDSKIIRSD